MKRFKFRLQAVLDQRKRIETQAKSSYAEAQSALVKALKLMEELEEVKAALLEELSAERLSGNFNPDESRMYHEYLKTITDCIRDQQIYVRELTSTAEAFRLNLVGASQNRQIVDKLHDKHQEVHLSEGLRTEQIGIDEIATQRFFHQKAASKVA